MRRSSRWFGLPPQWAREVIRDNDEWDSRAAGFGSRLDAWLLPLGEEPHSLLLLAVVEPGYEVIDAQRPVLVYACGDPLDLSVTEPLLGSICSLKPKRAINTDSAD